MLLTKGVMSNPEHCKAGALACAVLPEAEICVSFQYCVIKSIL